MNQGTSYCNSWLRFSNQLSIAPPILPGVEATALAACGATKSLICRIFPKVLEIPAGGDLTDPAEMPEGEGDRDRDEAGDLDLALRGVGDLDLADCDGDGDRRDGDGDRLGLALRAVPERGDSTDCEAVPWLGDTWLGDGEASSIRFEGFFAKAETFAGERLSTGPELPGLAGAAV